MKTHKSGHFDATFPSFVRRARHEQSGSAEPDRAASPQKRMNSRALRAALSARDGERFFRQAFGRPVY